MSETNKHKFKFTKILALANNLNHPSALSDFEVVHLVF